MHRTLHFDVDTSIVHGTASNRDSIRQLCHVEHNAELDAQYYGWQKILPAHSTGHWPSDCAFDCLPWAGSIK